MAKSKVIMRLMSAVLKVNCLLKDSKLILRILLYATAVSTLLNTAVMYFFPCFLPLCSFSAIRLTFIAFAEKRYALILVAAFVSALLCCSACAVKKGKIVTVLASLLYTIYDFTAVLLIFIEYTADIGISYSYWYLFPMTVSLLLITLLSVYLLKWIKKKKSKV